MARTFGKVGGMSRKYPQTLTVIYLLLTYDKSLPGLYSAFSQYCRPNKE